MTTIGVLAQRRSPLCDFLHRFFIAFPAEDISFSVLSPKSDFSVIDLFVFEKVFPNLAEHLASKEGCTVVIDAENPDIIPALSPRNLCVVTCGLSRKATVTASSVGEGGFTLCLQRSIFTLTGQELAPQEFGIHSSFPSQYLTSQLLGAAALLLCGINGKKIQEFMF